MDIIYPNAEQFNSKSKMKVWNFMRDAHLSYLLLYPEMLNQILNQYLFFMNNNYNNYEERVMKETKIDINKKFINMKNKDYDPDHIMCFLNLVYTKEASELDIKEMFNFYDKLLKHTDKMLGEKFMYGKKFNKKEINKISDKSSDINFIDLFPLDKLTVFIPKKCFDLDKYHDKKKYEKVIDLTYEKFIILEFWDCKRKFTHMDLWDIKVSCNRSVFYIVESMSLTDGELTIFFDY